MTPRPSRLLTGRPGAIATPLATAAAPRASRTEAPRDEAIRAPLVRLVDPNSGKVTGPFKPQDIVAKIDRKAFALVQVAPGAASAANAKTAQAASWTMDELPVCKLVSKRDEYHKQREAKKRAQSHAAPTTTKDLQLTWGVSGNDLAHKLSRARKDLARGHKVHAVILSKKGTRRVYPGTPEDAQRVELVRSIQDALCVAEDNDTPVARVTQGPEWKNQRSLCELHVEPLAAP